jgi:alkanesulfonate monooxygenase SsuD/methylene tetrahydromethanopterin reductase-like flavin-dependent oxidoreductase (luciferase family)
MTGGDTRQLPRFSTSSQSLRALSLAFLKPSTSRFTLTASLCSSFDHSPLRFSNAFWTLSCAARSVDA